MVKTTFLKFFRWLYVETSVGTRGWKRHVCVSVPKECACVITNLSAKQCDWLSHARSAPFPFPLFLFPGGNPALHSDIQTNRNGY